MITLLQLLFCLFRICSQAG